MGAMALQVETAQELPPNWHVFHVFQSHLGCLCEGWEREKEGVWRV